MSTSRALPILFKHTSNQIHIMGPTIQCRSRSWALPPPLRSGLHHGPYPIIFGPHHGPYPLSLGPHNGPHSLRSGPDIIQAYHHTVFALCSMNVNYLHKNSSPALILCYDIYCGRNKYCIAAAKSFAAGLFEIFFLKHNLEDPSSVNL